MRTAKFLIMAIIIATLTSCGTASKVPLTGRTHRISVSDEQILSLSNQEYTKYMATAKKSTDAANAAMVQRVGRNLAKAVENYLLNNGYQNELKNFKWEFNLVNDKSANAFCMPGGKIVVYEGLLPYTKNETGLAIVLGHEIAHAVAKHSAEQLTKMQNQQLGTSVLGTVLNSTVGSGVGDIASTVAGQYFSFRNLKYSRSNESEADYMGLIFAAMAGYDPSEAVTFWKRMAQASGNSKQSDIFSDHPSDTKRVSDIQGWLPEVQKYYKGASHSSAYTSSKKSSSRSVKASSLKRK